MENIKQLSDLKWHKAAIHDIGVKWHYCDIEDCEHKIDFSIQ